MKFLIKLLITSTFSRSFIADRVRIRVGCLQILILGELNCTLRSYTEDLRLLPIEFIDTYTPLPSTMSNWPMWIKFCCQTHRHYWLRPFLVMEGKRSDGRLLAAPSQMAAGTALRLADNQRTSKLRRALKPISVQSQEAKGTEQRKETAVDKDWASQTSQQAWKRALLALFLPFLFFHFCCVLSCSFLYAVRLVLIISFTFSHSLSINMFHLTLNSFSTH